jgi:hypothetical protein
MATVATATPESTISSEALGLLDCFAAGLDEIIYQLAEAAAVARAGSKDVEISVADMEIAATRFVEIMGRSELPAELKPQVTAMLDCFSHKVACRK